ncbi:MAG: hypothetical protein JXR39_09755 [Marinilabiliaceae bacterium]|nr:hypothetical protein [Marinilabiliaceae bacterium]
MNCSTFQQQIWNDASQLGFAEKEALTEHLSHCAECKAISLRADAVQRLINTEKNIATDTMMSQRIMNAIYAEPSPRNITWGNLSYKLMVAASVAVAIAIGTSLPILLNNNSSETTTTMNEMAYLDDVTLEGLDSWLIEP